MHITKIIKDNLYSFSGWKTSRKIVVIESDDWGSIRTQSVDALNAVTANPRLFNNAFNRVDALETQTDLEVLYDCLLSFKDINGEQPKITANFVTSNPDFEKIRESGYTQYFHEEFPESYKKYYNAPEIFDTVKYGMEKAVFFPQFHGREHVQAAYWMRDLKAGKKETIDAFNNAFFCFGKNILDGHGYLSAFNGTSHEELESVKEIIKEGLDIFEKLFGYRSRSVIAPQNFMHYSLLPLLKSHGVDIIQGSRVNKQTIINPGDKKHIRRFMGRTNAYGQLDIVRNVVFEPSSEKIDQVEKCIKEIETAFFWKKPAVICSHRINYIGVLDKSNRENSIRQLKLLLQRIQAKWPDVEFLNTVELADAIRQSNSK